MVKSPTANAGDLKDSIPELEKSPAVEHDNQFQYSCLENHMDRGAWQAKIQAT